MKVASPCPLLWSKTAVEAAVSAANEECRRHACRYSKNYPAREDTCHYTFPVATRLWRVL
jgi:hypothetical protein